ncbi:MAG: glycosyltransferase [Phycisphaerales bacterium]|nr:glycosyltransferase [Phycisphaerales bacterium]
MGITGPNMHVRRMDMHCHSSASSAPVIRPLGPLGIPESYSEPERVYEQARARGMDYVTLTDHDTIDGALHLIERGFPDVIVGQEVTTHFPEDRCKLHVLVWGLTPWHHQEIGEEGLRDDCYALATWLHERQLPHALAHPMYDQNGRLKPRHIERATLLFQGWEVLNGAHPGKHRRVVEHWLADLTPARIAELQRRQRLEPVWPETWRKARTAGSDDHALLNVGATWTEVIATDHAPVDSVHQFVQRVMRGDGRPGGQAGHASILAHQLTTVGLNCYARRLHQRTSTRGRYVGSRLGRFAGIEMKPPAKARLALAGVMGRLSPRSKRTPPLLEALRQVMEPLLAEHGEIAAALNPAHPGTPSPFARHEEMAAFADDLVQALSRVMAPGALGAFRRRDARRMMDHISSYAILCAAQAPYIFSLFHSNKERHMVEKMEHELSLRGRGRSVLDRPMKVCLITDTLGDVNGVCRFIQNMATCARRTGRDFRALTSTRLPVPEEANIVNFDPVFATTMPRYGELEVVLPPLTRMLRYVEAYQPDVIHISTPGPVGMVGLIAAKMARVPIVGVYHTDFPAYIERLFSDHSLTLATEQYMRFFYRRFARVLTRSESYLPALGRLGLRRDVCATLEAGIDLADFGRRFRSETTWQDLAASEGLHGLGRDSVKVIYCGRVSVEKNLPMLVDVWKGVRRRVMGAGVQADLVVIGDGPYRAQMERALAGEDAWFLGFRRGEPLARLYASGDLFLFPSTTDTLGQVVMEAQISGLPAVVTDEGGPCEIISDGVNGRVVPAQDLEGWVNAASDLIRDADLRTRMARAAMASMEGRDISGAFEHFWTQHMRVWHNHLRAIGIDPASKGIVLEDGVEAAAAAV